MLTRLQLPSELDGKTWRYAMPAGANRRHHHAELELNLVSSGSGTYLLGHRRYQIHRGDLLWLFPAQEHVLIEQTPDFSMWITVFRRRVIRRTATDPGARPLLRQTFAGLPCRQLSPRDLPRCEEIFAELASAEPGLLNAGLAYALLHAWKCFGGAGEVAPCEIHPSVERAARLMRDETGDYNLDELARRSGLSSSRLSRLFKEQTGLSIVEFRNRQRIERFLERFESNRGQTLLDSALEAGFGSYPQFHRVFRQIVGCSPAEYQRRRS